MTISDYIESDLKEKIRTGGELPDPLTLSSLAAHYDVSLTPIRAALEKLIDSNFILKGDNGRLRINSRRRAKTAIKKQGSPTASPRPDRDALITEDIIHLSIQGGPVYLREESSAQRYGVGRTVIRQVFNRLAGAGLIERVPRRGWRVHPFREQDMLDYIEVRETLELKALKLARKRLDPAQLEIFLKANSPDTRGRPQLENSLHQYWIDLSGNRYIRSFFAQFGIYYSYLFSYSTVATSVIEEKAAEHRKILRALLKEDWNAAYRLLLQHIQSQRPNVAHLFESIEKRETIFE